MRKIQLQLVLLSLSLLSGNVLGAICSSENGNLYSVSPSIAEKFSYINKDCVADSSASVSDLESEHLKRYDDQELESLNKPLWNNAYTSEFVGSQVKKPFHPKAAIFSADINTIASSYNIDPLLLHAIAYVESRYNPNAISHAGATGMMQIMPATARRFGYTGSQSELFDPVISLRISSVYLRKLYKLFGNDLSLVLAAYNAGEGAVIKYGRAIPPYKETQAYVQKVMAHYLSLKT